MKKLLIFTIVVLLIGLVGCDTGLFSTNLSPPAWMVGTWADEYDTFSWTLSSDNAVLSSPAMSVDFDELGGTNGVTVTDTATSIKYTIVMKADGETASFIFDKVSDAVVNFSMSTSGITVGPLPLLKS